MKVSQGGAGAAGGASVSIFIAPASMWELSGSSVELANQKLSRPWWGGGGGGLSAAHPPTNNQLTKPM